MEIKIDIKMILEIIPITAIILVFSGIFEQTVYFRFFGINLLSYLDFSEALILFLGDFIYLSIITTLSYFFYTYFQESQQTSNKGKKPIYYGILKRPIIILILLFGALVFFYFNIELLVSLILFSLLSLIIIGIIRLVVWAQKKVDGKFKSQNNKVILKVFSGFIIYLSILFGLGVQKYIGFLTTSSNQEITLKMVDTSEIKTSDSLKFIGKTEMAYFFYNVSNGESIVFPTNMIKMVTYKYSSTHPPYKVQ